MVLNGQYLPGYKGGGPIQSCVNMIENLYDEYDFYVVCSDRDFKSDKTYQKVTIGQWNLVGHAQVFYMEKSMQNIKGFIHILNSIHYDILYLNGFFSPIFTIKPLIAYKLGKIRSKRIILTPRGDFTGGCENKKIKKYSYIYLSKLLGLYRNIEWHATSAIEEQDIKKKFKKANTFVIPNLAAKYVAKTVTISKKVGELKLVFISRIFPKKNLKYALEVLREITEGKIEFDIYGPMEDAAYWNECEKVIQQMPDNVKVTYKGELEHSLIAETFQKYHAFFFPTLGENYGHVIVEAMMNNCLCILSKGVTPWDDYIEKLNIGSELNDMENFHQIISILLKQNNCTYVDILKANNRYIESNSNDGIYIEQYKNLLDK